MVRTILAYLSLQLTIMLISWPFLAAWGLPISPAALIAGPLFVPYITLFLVCATLQSLLTWLPLFSGLLATLLNTTATALESIAHSSHMTWLTIFAHPPCTLTIYLPPLTFLIIRTTSGLMRCMSLAWLATLCGIVIPYLCSLATTYEQTPYGTLYRSRGSTLLIARPHLTPGTIRSTLIPDIRRKGCVTLETIVLTKLSSSALYSLATLLTSIPVSKIYVPRSQENTPRLWHAWAVVCAEAERHGCDLHICTQFCTLKTGSWHSTITPHQDMLIVKDTHGNDDHRT